MPTNVRTPKGPLSFDDDDEGGWQEMPVVKEDEFASGLDEEDQKKYHYVSKTSSKSGIGNATGNLIDFDDEGVEWRSKAEQNENEYTRLRVDEEDEADEVHLRTRYLFDEDKAMTPLSQMQTTKNMLTEAQRIAYVGVCALTAREMVQKQKVSHRKELKDSTHDMELWTLKMMGRLYYHMELETAEQKMIDSLALHGVQASDLAPSLMTTHTISNPEYDPVEAKKQEVSKRPLHKGQDMNFRADKPRALSPTPSPSPSPTTTTFQTTARVLEDTSVTSSSLPGVTTTLSSVDKDVTLDIRWTVLCDLFLVLIADSVYDARSRVLLENVALKLGLGWIDVVRFESRVTEALEIQEGAEKLENQEIIDGSAKAARKKRYMMMGLATLGGGLVIGLSAGLLAPVIGAGLGAAFATVGISGTTGFLAGAGGAAVITTGGVLTGSGIAARGMARRTQNVRTFDVLPLHNNKRVSCILTVPGFMSGKQDDVRLPFSVLDPIVGDVFSVLWEPEMIQETGSALKILTSEILTQIGQTVLHHTAMTALMGALQWPIILTKLGYLIDNPWNNALDRARAAGSVLGQLLMQRHLGVRPITLIGFSLGARVIFYALLELAKAKAFGIVQDVFILGATLTASQSTWYSARSVVSGRFMNVYARNDWVLNYLFRATSGGLSSVAGLRPIEGIPGVENVDVTDKIAGHMSYRTFMPLILDQLGFPVSADYFDEPVEPDFKEDRVVIRDEELELQKKGWFSKRKKKGPQPASLASRPPSAASFGSSRRRPLNLSSKSHHDDLPPRMDTTIPSPPPVDAKPTLAERDSLDSTPDVPVHAGFDLAAIKEMIGEVERHPEQLVVQPNPDQGASALLPTPRSISIAPPPSISRAGTIPEKPVPYDEDTDTVHRGSPSSLSGTFATSVSLQEKDPYMKPAMSREDDQEMVSPKNGLSFSNTLSYSSTTSPPDQPQISFGGSGGSIWSSSIPVENVFTTAFGNPFATSTGTDLFSFRNGVGSPPIPQSRHPFTTYPTSPASPSLSFGSSDGTITLQGVESDPWGAPSEPQKTTSSAFSSNPWST
ncbi:hypothetical protein PAXRUDRAFT_142885 [Paxillus rubicundulus Ve08.2h10]|uniref:DUF726-domain-containing protein n=1 Tax=Paxillus rubicundulus Ve08.2h10 TaxID=930991 RepID=A0A0D0E7Y9_9AGAM|nr:hypothetical protein PAXRUDRAFT_142885 [Paxillus rubicundulus Ve08.2h10]